MTQAFDLREVGQDEWHILAWLFQAFRNDLSEIVDGYPYEDGRYQHARLTEYPGAGRVAYLAWRPHPKTGVDAPIGFAMVCGLPDEPLMEAFFVVPAARRTGVGLDLALSVVGRYGGAWQIPFQADNQRASRFWRAMAHRAWGDRWSETVEPVPGRPDVPPDHWIRANV